MFRWCLLLWLGVIFCLPAESQNQCTGTAVAPSPEYGFAVATSDSPGAYRWTLDGKAIQSGATSQTLLLHADGDATSTSGIKPLDQMNVSFQAGRWKSAFAVEQNGKLTYPKAALNLDEGTIEMWVAPRVDGSDPFYRTRDQSLFRYRAPSNGEMAIGISTVGGGFYAGIDPGPNFKGVGTQGFWSWKAQEWHHIAFTYSAKQMRMRFYLDGKLVSENQGTFVTPSGAGDRFSIGSDLGNQGAYVLLDEVRLSKEEKSPEEIGESAARTNPIGNNEVWLPLQGVLPGTIRYELTPANASGSCTPVSWVYIGIPLTGAAPASGLLAPGTDSVLVSVHTAAPSACGYSTGKSLEYPQMTPFDAGQGGTDHRTQVKISPDPKQLNHVFVRCDLAPGYSIEMKYRSIAAANPSFPRKGAIWMVPETMRANLSVASRISLFYGSFFSQQDIAMLRAANPDVLVFPSVSADEASDDTAKAWGIPTDYFLKDVNGKRIEGSWPLLYKLNLTRPEVADFLADRAYQINSDANFAYDGIFFDNFHTTMSYQSKSDAYGNPVKIDANGDGIEDDPVWLDSAWHDGVYRMLNRFRGWMPGALIAGHLGDTSAQADARAAINGDSIVSAATDVAEGRAQFDVLWSRYHGWLNSAVKPALDLIEGAPHNQIAYGYGIWDASTNIPSSTLEFARTYYPLVRFGLALTLTNDGYFVYNFGDVGTLLNDLKTIWWYDEYDFDLGFPLAPAVQLDTTMGANLIQNGSFERPWSANWILYSSGGVATVENAPVTGAPDGSAAAHVFVAHSGKLTDVQFWQPALPVVERQTYTVRFWARATPARPMNVGVLKNTPDYRNYGFGAAFNLTADWKEYVATFEANVTAQDARLCFYLGDYAGEVWLDNVVLMAGGDPVYRRDFTNGIVLLNGAGRSVRVDVGTGFARFSGQQAPRYQYLIDDGAAGFATTGNWRVAAVDDGFVGAGPKATGPYYHAWNGSCTISDDGAGVAGWVLNIPEDGEYTIQAWWAAAPDASKWSSRAVYEIVAAGKVVASTPLDQRSAGDQWHTLAKLWLSAADAPAVRVHSAGAGTLVADALHVFSTARLNDGSPVSSAAIGPKDGILLRRAASPAPQSPAIAVSALSLQFGYSIGGSVPAGQPVQVGNAGGGTLNWTAASNVPWLAVSPASGRAPSNITVSVVPGGLAALTAGRYAGTVQIGGTGAFNAPVTIDVSLTVSAAPAPATPAPAPASVVNGASFLPGAVAPGEIVAIFGSNMGPKQGAGSTKTSGTVDTTLSEVSVLFDTTPAPILYARADQINAIVPYGVAGKSSAAMRVQYQGVLSSPITVSVANSAPGIFQVAGSTQGAILNQDYSANSDTNPARRGSVVMVYLTGEGQTIPSGQDGLIIPADPALLKKPALPVSVTIGGESVPVQYAGSAPGLVSGVMQVNVPVPNDLPPGNALVVVTVGGAPSQSNVTVALR